jgi:hypothetical protein
LLYRSFIPKYTKAVFGTKEKWRNFIGFEPYRKLSYAALWNKGLEALNSYDIPMEWLPP